MNSFLDSAIKLALETPLGQDISKHLDSLLKKENTSFLLDLAKPDGCFIYINTTRKNYIRKNQEHSQSIIDLVLKSRDLTRVSCHNSDLNKDGTAILKFKVKLII